MSPDTPMISVVIPTFNRPAALARCLASLCRQTCPKARFEVIVVDDGGPQPAAGVVSGFEKRLDVRCVFQPHRGPAAARNRGAALARGRFVAFIDDDCIASKRWLERLCLRFEKSPQAAAVGGRVVNLLSANAYAEASQLLVDRLRRHLSRGNGHCGFVTSNNLAVDRRFFWDLGGFDESFKRAAGEDRDLCDRWGAARAGLIFAPEARVYHAHRLTLRSFMRQHFNYGCGARQFRRKKAARCPRCSRFEPLSFYTGIVRQALQRRGGSGRFHLAVLTAASQAANGCGYLWQVINEAPGER